jgi:hypothetical protein
LLGSAGTLLAQSAWKTDFQKQVQFGDLKGAVSVARGAGILPCDILQEALALKLSPYEVLVELLTDDLTDDEIDEMAACTDGLGIASSVFVRALNESRPGYAPPSLAGIEPGEESVIGATRAAGARVPVSPSEP